MYGFIRLSCWVFLITSPAIFVDSMTCDGVIIDYVIDMN